MRFVAITVGDRYLRVEDDSDQVRCDGVRADVGSTFERVELDHGRVALRTAGGRYLCHAPDDARGSALVAVDDLIPCAAFEEVLWPDGSVSLRSCRLTYLSAGSGLPTLGDSGEPTLDARFRYVEVARPVMPVQRRASRVALGLLHRVSR